MRHFASLRFRALYAALPLEVRTIADKNYQLLKGNPQHPSLHLKRIGPRWSVRIGQHYRALGREVEGGVLWFWIGTHAEYDRLIAAT